MYGGFFRASPLRTNPMSLPHSHIHAHTDALVDHDGMRSGGAKRRCASAAELRRHHLHILRAYQSGQDHVADPPGGLEDWHRYILVRVEEMDDTQSQMDEMFAKIRNEIGGIERRIKEFNAMVDELVRMVGAMQKTERVRQAAMTGGGGLQIRAYGLMNGFWIRSATSATRMPPYPARGAVSGGRRMESRQQPRTPPSVPHPAATPSPLSAADSRRLPASVSSRSRSRQARQAASSAAVISRPSSPSPPPAPPRPARNDIHLRFFHRVFHISQNANIPASVQRRPSPERTPSPVDIQPPPPPPSPGPGFGFHESPSASLIAETRTRLPPLPKESPIPYRPLGQRMFLFLNRP